MASQLAWLKLFEKVWGLIKEALKENISKKNILINKVKEIYEKNEYKYIENILESFVTRLQRCIKLEGYKTCY